MFIAILFITDLKWKQSECLLRGQMNKLQYVHTMEHYSVIKMKWLPINKKSWINHRCTPLSERGQSEKATHYTVPTLDIPESGNKGDIKRKCVCQRRGGRWVECGLLEP